MVGGMRMNLGRWFDVTGLAALVLGLGALYAAAVVIRTADLILFFLPYVLAGSIVLTVLFLTWRRRHLLLMMLMLGGSIAVLPVFAERSEIDGGTRVRVATINMLSDKNADLPALKAWLDSRPADIILVQEAPHDGPGLRGITNAYPVVLGPYSWDVALLTRYPVIGEPRLLDDGVFTKRKRIARVELDVTDRSNPNARRETLVVYAVHAQTPRSKEKWRERNRLLAVLEEAVNSEAPGTRVVVGGDFNTPTWSPWIHKLLLTTPLRLADESLWPVATRYFREFGWPQFFGSTVDHVMVGPGVEVERHRVGPDVGSDHLPVVVDVELH